MISNTIILPYRPTAEERDRGGVFFFVLFDYTDIIKHEYNIIYEQRAILPDENKIIIGHP